MKALVLHLLALLPLAAHATPYETPYCRTTVWAVDANNYYIVAEVKLTEQKVFRKYFRHGDLEIGAGFTAPSFPGNGKNVHGINAMVKVGGKMLMYSVARGSESGKNILSLALATDPDEEKKPNTCFGRVNEVIIDCTNPANKAQLDARWDSILKDTSLGHTLPDCQ